MSSEIPKGRVRRLARMARAGAVAGAGAVLGRKSDAAAAYASEILSELRGLAAKAGQMAGYVDGFVPPGQRKAFEAAMGSLQAATRASPPVMVRELVERELAQSLEQAFSQWEETPFASASIGQVHRARLPDQTLVAVKVQHPGIADAFENDLSNAAALESVIARLIPSGFDVDAIFEEITARFREELDYLNEARNLETFRSLHSMDPGVHVPRCYETHSSLRVLTCAFCHGETLDQACGHPEPFRQDYARTLWRFVTRSMLIGGAFNADPHPGNYLFTKDGKVVFLDFGCVQRFGQERKELNQALHRAAIERDEASFSRAVADWYGSHGGVFESGARRFMRLCFEPIFASPFRFTPEFAARVVKGIQEFKALMFSRDRSFAGFPPETVFLNRLQFGFYSVLAKLDVEVDYALEEEHVFEELVAVAGAV